MVAKHTTTYRPKRPQHTGAGLDKIYDHAYQRYMDRPQNKVDTAAYINAIKTSERYSEVKSKHKKTLEKEYSNLLKKEENAKKRAYYLLNELIDATHDSDVDFETLLSVIKEWRKIAKEKRQNYNMRYRYDFK